MILRRHGFYDYGTPFTRDEIINALNSFEYNEVIREKHLSTDRYCLYRKNLYNLEIDIVQRLKNIISEFKAPFCTKKQIDEFIKYYESTYKFELAEKQKEAIHMALTKPISILTGSYRENTNNKRYNKMYQVYKQRSNNRPVRTNRKSKPKNYGSYWNASYDNTQEIKIYTI